MIKSSLSMAYTFLLAGDTDLAWYTFKQVLSDWKNKFKRALVLD